MAIELATLTDLKIMLDISGTSNDTKLTLIRDGVTTSIEQYIGRMLTYAQYTDIVRIGAISQTMIALKALPIESVDDINIVSDGADYSEDLEEDTDFLITNYGIKLLFKPLMSMINITYTGGYEETADVPDAIKRAALLQTVFEFSSGATTGATSISTEGGSVQYPKLGLLNEVKNLLNEYKHPFMVI